MVRFPLIANAFDELVTSRCSSWSTGIWPPPGAVAVPWITTVPAPVWTGRCAVTLAIVVWSIAMTVPLASFACVCRTSPGWRYGVLPAQQPPPGWFTSTRPVAPCGTTSAALATMLPLRITTTSTVAASVNPSDEMKSRAGKPMIECPPAGGSLTGTAGGGAFLSSAVTLLLVAAGLSLLAASVARTEYVYVAGGRFTSVYVVGGLLDPSGFWTVAT